ncbi:MAG: hypothetical protein Q9169_001926 [Polycauliona sp. 2 TL-2023]
MDEQLPPPPYSLQDPTPRPPASTFSTDNADHASDDTAFVSGAAYFAMRPPTLPKPSNTLPCLISVPSDDTSSDLPMPELQQSLIDRDVSPHDWTAFINHLVPHINPHGSRNAGQEKVKEKHPIDPAPLGWPSTERRRQQLVKDVTQEWNHGFFLPRGIEIIARLEVTPSPQATPPSTGFDAPVPRPPTEAAVTRPAADQNNQAKSKRDAELGLALRRAVERKEVKTAKVLLEAGADPDARPSWETPSIVIAAKNNDSQLVQMLLEHDLDTEAHAPGSGAALYTAVTKGHPEIVKLLLAYGADPNKRPSGTEPALYKAVSKQHVDIVELLLQQPNLRIDDTPPGGTTAMYRAAKKGNTELVRKLLAAGAKVDAAPMGTNSAMFEAAKRGDYDICKFLLEQGAEVDRRTTGGDTALCNVVGKKDMAIIRLLLEHGAKINAKAWGGETALQKAVSKGKHDQVELLLQYK